MMYFDNLGKLTVGMSKDTQFFVRMLQRMEYHAESKLNIVDLTARIKVEIVNEISPKVVDKQATASQYLFRLKNQGRIKFAGNGSYIIDPAQFGYAKYVGVNMRRASGEVYENRVYLEGGETKVEAYIITPDGERVDLT
jgi:hypothetical protein